MNTEPNLPIVTLSAEDLRMDLQTFVEENLTERCEYVDYHRLRQSSILDSRAWGGGVWFCNDFLMIESDHMRSLSYYGGFEDVDSEFVVPVGPYTVYFKDGDRVDSVLSQLTEKFSAKEGEDSDIEDSQECESV
jgi:hypothetical protein